MRLLEVPHQGGSMTNSPEQIAKKMCRECPSTCSRMHYVCLTQAARLAWQAGRVEAFGECLRAWKGPFNDVGCYRDWLERRARE